LLILIFDLIEDTLVLLTNLGLFLDVIELGGIHELVMAEFILLLGDPEVPTVPASRQANRSEEGCRKNAKKYRGAALDLIQRTES
jgi:hypothetical protein